MPRVFFAIAIAIALMIAAVAWLGSRLPVGHVASRAVVIGAPIDVVFTTITEFESAASWRGLKSVTVDTSTGRKRVTEVSSTGPLTMEVEELVPPTRLVMRIVGESAFGGAWAYALEPEGNATRVTITEHGEVYNPLFRFVSKFIMGHTGTIDAYLTSLGRKFESDVVPVDAEPVPLRVGGRG
jgi:uncharacterized protein YndB with AHSA1/START domain